MSKKRLLATGALVASTIFMIANVQAGETFNAVKKKGFIQCGVNTGTGGFSIANDKGEWEGIDVDFCRAMAAAMFGDATKVKYTPTNAKERLTALQSGEIDVLSRNTTWTLTRDTNLGLQFVGVNYYDGQSFMVKKALGVKSAKELDGATVCIQAGTTTELNLADYFRSNNMKFEPVTFDKQDEATASFENDRCDVLTTDQSQLYAIRAQIKDADKIMILPEVISKEPLGPAVRQGDTEWFNLARWTLFAMIEAEELGLTSTNIDEQRKGGNPEVKRFVGDEGIGGQGLKVANDWAYQIVKQVGNYGESFERNVGQASPMKVERGLNALWKNGGLQYAMPLR